MYPCFGMATPGSNPVEAGRELTPPVRRRRRLVRQRVHTPAYASLNGGASGQVLDLSEIVDIHQEGMAIQVSSPLRAAQRSVDLCLDLTATRACIRTTGEVVWADGSGRRNRFPQMPDESLRQLKEWLFVNLLSACANQRAERFFPVAPPAILEKSPQDSALVNWMRRESDPGARGLYLHSDGPGRGQAGSGVAWPRSRPGLGTACPESAELHSGNGCGHCFDGGSKDDLPGQRWGCSQPGCAIQHWLGFFRRMRPHRPLAATAKTPKTIPWWIAKAAARWAFVP